MTITKRDIEIIVAKFRLKRLEQKCSVRQAAGYLDMDHTFLFRIEKREEKPPKMILYKMALYLINTQSL